VIVCVCVRACVCLFDDTPSSLQRMVSRVELMVPHKLMHKSLKWREKNVKIWANFQLILKVCAMRRI
jgi:hypothetical protein